MFFRLYDDFDFTKCPWSCDYHIIKNISSILKNSFKKAKPFHGHTACDLSLSAYEDSNWMSAKHMTRRARGPFCWRRKIHGVFSLNYPHERGSIDRMDARENIAWMNQALNEFVLLVVWVAMLGKEKCLEEGWMAQVFQMSFFFSQFLCQNSIPYMAVV